jgi:Asp-tRNA(Asn)/Glu-tRNA(Gln) amidotransferase A subunit family amidase
LTSDPVAPPGPLLGGLSAVDLVAQLSNGELAAAEVAQAFLKALGEDELRAWETVDPELLLADAARLDALPEGDRKRLPLFGLPVGIKDNFNTAELPTGYGSPIYAGQRPAADSALVARLRAAGALIAGKLKCAEFAWMYPSDTLNPIDLERTPGGSSSGSAAAVGAATVPIATGTQTAGSINRPASYCGVLGYKPTFGLLPREGVKLLAESLDTVGLFARSAEDLELVAAAVGAPLRRLDAPRRAPRLAFARTPLWERIEADAAAALESAVATARAAGASVEELTLSDEFEELVATQTTIQWYESAISLAPELEHDADRLSDELRAALLEGQAMPAAVHLAAKRVAAGSGQLLGELLAPYDGVLTPSTTGVPPVGLSFTGDPVFSRAWTLIGAPCVSLPLAWTADGLPAGLQLVGAPGTDARTLSAAAWLMTLV